MQTFKQTESRLEQIPANPKEGFIMKPFVLHAQSSHKFTQSRWISALVVSVSLLAAFLLVPASPAAAQGIGVDDINNFWGQIFAAAGQPYTPPTGIIPFDRTGSDGVRTACGDVQPSAGPFYCPNDQIIYWDVLVGQELSLAENDDTIDYAILAHEWGHHIQNLLGYLNRVYSIERELQADCFAGAYLKHAQDEGYLAGGLWGYVEISGVITAFGAMGDDLPLTAPGHHGDFNQREAAFTDGLQNGVGGCGKAIDYIVVNVQGLSLKPTQPVSLSVKALGRAGLEISAKGLNAESVELQVFDMAGQLLFSQESHSGVLRYRGLNSAGRPLANGVYLYVITVHTVHGEILHKVQKVAVLR
jgi:hypothetical protein